MGKRKTTEEFKEEVYKSVGNEYSVLSDYKGCETKIKMKHNKCGSIFEINPSNFKKGFGCHKCNFEKKNKKRTKTTEKFINEVKEMTNNEYSVLGKYVNNKTKIKMKHNICNNEYEVRPYRFIQGDRCPYCRSYNEKTTEDFIKKVYELVGNEYSVLSEYKNCETKIKMKHNLCNNEYEVTPHNFTSTGNRCPYCKSSKGEVRIRKYLEDNNIYFQEQYSFNDCRNVYPLKFDFYLEDDSGKIILIEYDGEQHFKQMFYSDEYNESLKRDKIKDDYCNNHDNIDLYRISYKEFDNIETILNDIISSYEKKK
jgi:Zn ribbon nucleic-acid-binding protein